jgi:hypothetical protein
MGHFERERAVAKTWRPRLEKEELMPPAEQPVMRAYLVGVGVGMMELELEREKGGWRK